MHCCFCLYIRVKVTNIDGLSIAKGLQADGLATGSDQKPLLHK